MILWFIDGIKSASSYGICKTTSYHYYGLLGPVCIAQ
jgi:hypothetical protein